MGLTRALKVLRARAKQARQSRWRKELSPDECDWDGTVNHDPDVEVLDSPEPEDVEILEQTDLEGEEEEEDCLDGEELLEEEQEESHWDLATAVNKELLQEMRVEAERELNAYDLLMVSRSKKEWKAYESKRELGYTGHSDRHKRRFKLNSKKAAEEKEKSRTRYVSLFSYNSPFNKTGSSTGKFMLNFFARAPVAAAPHTSPPPSQCSPSSSPDLTPVELGGRAFVSMPDNQYTVPPLGYESDLDSDVEAPEHDEDPSPPPKRRKLDIPRRQELLQKRERLRKERELALAAINKLIRAKTSITSTAPSSLQAVRARAVQSCLRLIVKDTSVMKASEITALAHGFSPVFGARLVRNWVRLWTLSRELPTSSRGSHIKSFSVLDDPIVLEGARTYLRTHKWVTDPQKFQKYINNELLPTAAREYVADNVEPAMRNGLRHYLEVELFPRIHFKPARGVSLKTSERLMKKLGFGFVEHAKAIYFDGHERPDVVDDRQDRFIPEIDSCRDNMVEYVVGDVNVEKLKSPLEDHRYNCVQPRFVLAAHDEMTCQCHDDKGKSWGPVDEQPLKKKGVGRGIHRSEVICSTVGWMKKAGESLEYGKNHEGWWNGEMFCKQVIYCDPSAEPHAQMNTSCAKRSSQHLKISMDLDMS